METLELTGNNVQALIDASEVHYNGLSSYLLDDTGSLRPHVNIYIGNKMIADRESLSDRVNENDEVYIVQAISGG